jgi:hypothetical protein
MVASGAEGHVAAMSDGGGEEVGWPRVQTFWKKVRTKSVGRRPRRDSGARCCGLGEGEVEAWAFRPRRKMGQLRFTDGLEGAL